MFRLFECAIDEYNCVCVAEARLWLEQRRLTYYENRMHTPPLVFQLVYCTFFAAAVGKSCTIYTEHMVQ